MVSAEGNDRKVGADDVGPKGGLVSENLHQDMDANGSNSILPSKEEKFNRYAMYCSTLTTFYYRNLSDPSKTLSFHGIHLLLSILLFIILFYEN